MDRLEMARVLRGRTLGWSGREEDGFLFSLAGGAARSEGAADRLRVASHWWLSHYGEPIGACHPFSDPDMLRQFLRFDPAARVVTDVSVPDSGGLKILTRGHLGLHVEKPRRALSGSPVPIWPRWRYERGGAALCQWPPVGPLGGYATVDRAVYRFHDAAVPPPDHRSYAIAVTRAEAGLIVDSYGEVIAEEQVAAAPTYLAEVAAMVADGRIATARPADARSADARPEGPDAASTHVCGGTAESLALHAGSETLFEGHAYHGGGETTLFGALPELAARLRLLFPYFKNPC